MVLNINSVTNSVNSTWIIISYDVHYENEGIEHVEGTPAVLDLVIGDVKIILLKSAKYATTY